MGGVESRQARGSSLAELTVHKYGGTYYSTPVGELNVIEEMHRTGAIIGGEGNGGVIYPALHYGRDALVGVALFLSFLGEQDFGAKASRSRSQLPQFYMTKRKILNNVGSLSNLSHNKRQSLINQLQGCIPEATEAVVDQRDGIKIVYQAAKTIAWIHLRVSNTEPIMRLYGEAKTQSQVDRLADRAIEIITQFATN